jgi:hypothetical protein
MHLRSVALLALALLAAGCGDPPEDARVIPDRERSALETLYRATGGDQWRMRDGWLGARGSECGWYGVTCTAGATEVHIVGIRLHRNRLSRTLPEALADLRKLQSLDLHSNRLAGEIPQWLAQMPALERLRLSDNRYDSIGGQLLGHGPDTMDFSGNQLRGALPDLPSSAPGPEHLNLSNNALDGGLPASWFGMQRLRVLDVSGNALAGSLTVSPQAWPRLRELVLADNDFSGRLPVGLAQWSALRVLDLSGNGFTGFVPPDWSALNLDILDVSDNRLAGDPAPAFAMASCHIGLRGNDFAGTLDAARLEGTAWEAGPAAGRVDLCFNPLEFADAASRRLFTGLQAGGDLAACLGRERLAVDASISGSWRGPAHSGRSLALLVLEDRTVLAWQFGHDADGEPQWQVGQNRLRDTGLRVRELLAPRGLFEQGFGRLLNRQARGGILRADRVGSDRMRVSSVRVDPHAAPCRRRVATHTVEMQREGRPGACLDPAMATVAGVWYDPDRYGEGLIVQPLDAERARVTWATFRADDSGRPTWMTGIGRRTAWGLAIREMVQPIMRAGQAVDRPWGSLQLRLEDAGTARVDFRGPPEYGEGTFPARRLAAPAGC